MLRLFGRRLIRAMSSDNNKFQDILQKNKNSDEILNKLHKDIQALIQANINTRYEEQRKELEAENEFLKTECEHLLNRLNVLQGGSVTPSESNSVPQVTAKVDEPKKDATPPKEDAPTLNKQSQKKKSEKKASSSDKKKEEELPVDVSRLDFRVGRILEANKHPDADSLYVEQIDVGEEQPRTVVSGLVKFVPIDQMQNRLVVVLCNLKPAKMRGVLSQAMVMCASTPEKVEILSPPEGSVPGDVVTFEGYPGKPDDLLNPKKKIFEQVAPDLKTNDDLIATYKGVPFSVSNKGPVKAASLANVIIK